MITIKHNFDESKFKWLWAKYVNAGNIEKHCTACLKGPYSSKFNGTKNKLLHEQTTMVMDEVPEDLYEAIYFCGVIKKGYLNKNPEKNNYPHNVHFAVVPQNGAHDVWDFEGWHVEIENGKLSSIPTEDQLDQRFFQEPYNEHYLTCRIFRWMVGFFFPQYILSNNGESANNRDKMICELQSKVITIATNLTLTYDMGMQFDVITSNGMCNNLGNVGNWPCYKMPLTKGLINLRQRLIDGCDVKINEILKIKVCKYLLTYTEHYSNVSYLIEGELLQNCIKDLIEEIKKLDIHLKAFYAFVDIESWSSGTVKFFKTQKEMDAYFGTQFGISEVLYEDMSDDELKYVYETAKDENWSGVPFFDYTKK